MSKIKLCYLKSVVIASILFAAGSLVPTFANIEKTTCDTWQAYLDSTQHHKLEILYETPDACSTGNWQTYDISSKQSVAIRFALSEEQSKKYTLEKLEFWMMNNSKLGRAQVFISLRTNDDATGTPSDKIIESWVLTLTRGTNAPKLEELYSSLNPVLKQDKLYWIVAEALTPDDTYYVGWNKVAPAFQDDDDAPKIDSSEPYLALKTADGNGWQPMFGPETSTVSIVVKGKPA